MKCLDDYFASIQYTPISSFKIISSLYYELAMDRIVTLQYIYIYNIFPLRLDNYIYVLTKRPYGEIRAFYDVLISI